MKTSFFCAVLAKCKDIPGGIPYLGKKGLDFATRKYCVWSLFFATTAEKNADVLTIWSSCSNAILFEKNQRPEITGYKIF